MKEKYTNSVKIVEKLNANRHLLIISLIYLLLAIFFTFPLIFKFTTNIPGVDEDSPTHVWYLWWFKFSVLDLRQNPFYTDYIFYPQVINRTFDIHTFTNAIFSLPFQFLFGLIAASNIIFYIGFVLSGLGTFFLSFYLTKSKLASFFAGLVFAFFPYIFAQSGDYHTNLITAWFTPFYLLFLLKTLKEGSYKNAFFTGLFFGLQGLNDLTYTSFTMFLTLLVIFYYFIFWGKELLSTSTLKRLVTAGITFLVIFSPFALAAFKTIKEGFHPGVSLSVQNVYGADISYFLFPWAGNPLLNKFSKAPSAISSTEGTLYIGYTVLFLVLIYVFFLLKKNIEEKKQLGLFYFLAFSFFILSLGPRLHFFESGSTFNQFELNPTKFFLLPFIFYHKLPFIGGIQEPIRMHPFTMLPLAILTAFSLKEILSRTKKKVGLIIFAITVSLLLIEYTPSLPTTNLTVPKIYQDIARESGDFVILDLPVGWNTGNFIFGYGPIGSLQFYQSVHQKKIFRGTVARLPAENVFYYRKIPLLHYLAEPGNQLVLEEDLNRDIVQKTFKDLKVKYILIHKKYYEEGRRSLGLSVDLIENVLKAKKFYDEENIIGYQLY